MPGFGPALASAAAAYGVNKAGNAIFGNGSANQLPSQSPNPPGGPGGMQQPNSNMALQMLAHLQQQLQQEEQQRQQAIMALLSQFTMPQQRSGSFVGEPVVGPGPQGPQMGGKR